MGNLLGSHNRLSARYPLASPPPQHSILSSITALRIGVIAQADNRATATFPVVLNYMPLDWNSAVNNVADIELPTFTGEDMPSSQFLPIRKRTSELLGRAIVQFNEEMRDGGKQIASGSRAAKQYVRISNRLPMPPNYDPGYQAPYTHYRQRVMGQFLDAVFDNDNVRARFYKVSLTMIMFVPDSTRCTFKTAVPAS